MPDWLYLVLALSLILSWSFIIRELWRFNRITNIFLNTTMELKNIPKVSVIVPAKDEGASIQQCLSSLAGQTYKNLECILVNDRSKDSTGAIMEEFAKTHSHFKAISIQELPSGWLGKTHALQKGAELASGEYLLFTDGDVLFEKDAVFKTMQMCLKRMLDHLCLIPKLHSKGWLLSSLNIFFGVFLLSFLKPSRVGKNQKFYAGMGAFNLVKRSAYQSIGEHKKLRLEILDDIMLGKLISFSGFSSAMIYGKSLISLTWYANVKEMVSGFEKNGFTAVEYSVLYFILTGFYLLYFYLPFVFVFFSPQPAQAGFILSLLLMQGVFITVAKKLDYNLLMSFLAPFSAWFVYFAQVRSVFLGLTRGQITWRETSYSLKELKNTRKKLFQEIHG